MRPAPLTPEAHIARRVVAVVTSSAVMLTAAWALLLGTHSRPYQILGLGLMVFSFATLVVGPLVATRRHRIR